jgi:methylmalonyl-CoA/ethylmalonyl-CoA epimerase
LKVLAVDHIGIAVNSIPDALRLFVDTLGGEFVSGGDGPNDDMRTVTLELGGAKIELIQPLGEDSYLQRFIDKHGQGFHHVTVFVEDLFDAIASLERSGYEVVDTNPASPLWQETYLRPRSGFGTLIQIVQTNRGWDEPFEGITLDAILNGDVKWVDDIPTLRDPDEPRPRDPSRTGS